MKEKKEDSIKQIVGETKQPELNQDAALLNDLEAAEDVAEVDEAVVGDESLPGVVPAESTSPTRETVVCINRVTKVVSGGKRFAFSAVTVAGDGNGKVGVGKGKARDVQMAITKASYQAKKNMLAVPLSGTTIPCSVIGSFGAAKVLMRPAVEGTGVVAGGAIRAVLEACGVKDILTKNLGTSNTYNVVYATLDGLSKLRTKEEFFRTRGKKLEG